MRVGAVQPGEEKGQGDLINMHKYLQGGNEEEGARLFSVVPTDGTRGDGCKLPHMKFSLNTQNHCFL